MHLWQIYIIINNRAIMPQKYNKNVYSPNIFGENNQINADLIWRNEK